MADNVFLRSPVDMALAEGEAALRPAASGAPAGSPKLPRLSIEDASASYKVPANLIQALGEAGGLTEEQIAEAAPKIAEALSGPLGAGRKHSEAIRAILPSAPEGFERQVVERSNALYDEIYAPPAVAPEAPAGEEAEPITVGGIIQKALDPWGTTGEVLKGAARGVAGAVSAGARTLGYEETAKAAGGIADDERLSPGVGSYKDIRGPGDAARYAAGLGAESAPEMAATIGATIVGTGAGGPLAGIAAGVATSSFFNTGRNLQRQEAEQPEQEPSMVRAVGTGLAQAGLDQIVPGRIAGDFGARLIGAMAEKGAVKVTKEIGEDAVIEAVTEGAQQLMEIGQANPDLLRIIVAPNEGETEKSDQLLDELVESMVGGGVAGGTFSGGGKVLGSAMRKPEPEPVEGDAEPAPEMLALPAPALITPPPPREDPAAPPPAAGPLSAALQAAPARVAPDLNPGDRITLEPEGVSPIGAVVLGEAPGGLRVRDDDGQELEIPREEIEAGTTRITPADAPDPAPDAQQDAPAPMLDAPEAAIAPGGLAETAAQTVQPPAPAAEPEAPADPLEAARERLAFIDQQGRTNGWNGRLVRERKALREQIAALEPPAPAAEPLSEPLKTGPIAAPEPAGSAPVIATPAEATESAKSGGKSGKPLAYPALSNGKDASIPGGKINTPPAQSEGQEGQEGVKNSPAGVSAPAITQIREKAGLVTGIDQAAADKIAAGLNIKFAPDKKSGGFTFSWKHADRIREAVGDKAPTKADAVDPLESLNADMPEGFSVVRDASRNLNVLGPAGEIVSNLAAGYDTMSPQQKRAVRKKAIEAAEARRAKTVQPERRPSPPQIEPLAGMSPMGKRTVIAPVDKDGAPTGPKVVINRLTREEMEAELDAKAKAPTAEAIAEAASAADPEPTDGQKEAGNYRMGHARVQGLDITIENAKGSTRSGKAPDGTEWSVEMPAHYGYIKRTEGADGDHVDVYLGENPESDKVWVIDQVDAETKAFDEHKVMIGFPSASEAEITYLEGFSDGKGRARMGAVTFMTMAEFKAAVADKAQWAKGPLGRVNARQEKPKAKLGAAPVLDAHLTGEPKPAAKPKNPARAALEAAVAKGEPIAGIEDAPAYGAANKLVSADRAAELRERLKAKLRDQLSAGIDPEILAIGAELAVFHIEAGARRFADFAKAVAADLDTTPMKLKPYLRAWYQGAQAMLEDGDHDASGMDGPDEVRAALAEIGKAPESAAPPAPAAGDRPSLFVALTDRLAKGEGFASISEARKFAAEITGEKVEAGTMAAKTLDETIEAAVVEVADMIAREGSADPLATYRKMVALYAAQPRLGVRTSDSIARQAYSTPAPLAYLASRLAGVGPETVVFEPSAGNGMLLIGAHRDRALVNEIDPERAKALVDAGFSRVSQKDAMEIDAAVLNGKPVDAVIANPPFGPVKGPNGQNKVFEVSPEYSTREIDHAISFKALDAMKDDGRAVLLIAGLDKTITDPEKRSDAYNTKARREFYIWLKRNYRVADHFTVAGELYEKQGAGWPIDVIVIEGRGEGSRPVPAVNLPKLYSSWESLEEKLGGDNAADRSPPQPSDRDRGDARAPKRVDRDPVRDDGGVRPDADGRPGRDGGDAVREPGDGAASGDAGDAGLRVPEAGPDVRPERPAGRAAPVGAKAGKAAASGETQVPYKPASGGKSVDTLVPVNMAEDVAQALAAIKAEHGDIDVFVAKELGYPKKELASRFSAEQVDALAMALVNIQKNAGFVIGDQTGIGKGRVVAGMIRYALKKGYKPIFVTEKPNLYADMWRDMTDIGIPEMLGRAPVVLPTNAGLSMALDEDGVHKIKTGTTKAHDAYMRENVDQADMIFTTYTQMQTRAGDSPERRQIIQSQIPNAVLIFDESHNAGGQGPKRGRDGEIDDSLSTGPMNRAEFARAIAQQARAVMFSSATYAKRPEVMDLYAKTDMILAVDNPAMLGEAIAKGGIPMQQVVASMLSRAGQYLRRERSFKGIDYKTVDVEVDRSVYDNASRILDAIRLFSKEVQSAAKRMDKEMKADGKAVSGSSSTGGAGVDSTNFTSVMHNLIDAMLLAVNAKPAADRAIAHLKAGRKPVLTVNFTMGALLQEYVSDNGLAAGAPIDLTFNRLFDRYLEKSRWVSERKPFMKKGEKAEKKYLTDDQLGPAGLAAFARAKAMIEEATFADYPVSPIDYMRDRITKAGFKVAEITGRSAAIDYSGPKMTLTSVPSEEQGAKGRTTSVRGFNNGGIDALILNQAGSTGLSLHASEKAKDQRPRTMLIVQAASNIDTHMQMLGRVNRTGQVVLPDYEQLAPNIPATIRPAAVLAKKMASLNANTTASRKSALSDDSIDVLNAVGDQAVMELMNDEPGLNDRLGEPVKAKDKSEEGQDVADDIARRVTGRIPLLPVDEQERIYSEIFRRYRQKIAEAESRGENPLEAQTLDADAVMIEETIIAPKGGPSPFQDAVHKATYDINSPVRPIDVAKLTESMAEDAEIDLPDGTDEEKLAAIRRAFDAAPFEAAWEAHRRWTQEQIEASASEEQGEDFRARQREISGHFRSVMTMVERDARPGSAVELIDMVNGFTLPAIVTRARRAGRTLNPLAGSAWEINIQVAGIGAMTIPFSQVATSVKDGQYAFRAGSEAKILGLIRDSAKARREKRIILTGNLLTAYEIAGGRGSIVNFTTREGELKQGLMLRKDQDLENVSGGFRSGAHVIEYVAKAGNIASTDSAISIAAREGKFRFEIAASKAKGGKYFLNAGVQEAAGAPFVSVGGNMRLDVEKDRAVRMVENMRRAGASFVGTDPEIAREVGGEAAAPKKGLFAPGERPATKSVAHSIAEAPRMRAKGFPAGVEVIAPFTSDAEIKANADYRAAKSGDAGAATRLAFALFPSMLIRRARARFGTDVIYAPVVAEEASGDNRIPHALARHIQMATGAEFSADILQSKRAFHTGAKAMERLIARVGFVGAVRRGRRYVLVDDVSVMGSTLADMADHIVANGGEVAGVILFANAGRSDKLSVPPHQARLIERRFGDAVRELFGVDPGALTANEAAYLVGFRDADELRARAVKAQDERRGRLDHRGATATESRKERSVSGGFASTKDLRDHLVALPDMGGAIAALIDSGFITLYDTPPAGENPSAAGSTYIGSTTDPAALRPVQGVSLYAANLRPETAAAVVLHEMFHAGGEAIVGVPAWNALLARVETMRAAQQAKATEKDHPAFQDAEEFAAYNLQHYHEDMPKGVRAAVDRLAGVVKAFLLRKFGRQIGRVTRPQLRALAAAALRDQARRKAAPGAGGRARHSVDAPSIPAVTPQQMETMERGLIGNAITKAMEGGRDGQVSILGLVPGRPLFGELAKRMPQAQEYLDLKTKMSALRNEWHARMDGTAQAWRELVGQDGAANKRLMDLMHEATLAGIDPSKPFQADPDPRKRAAEEARRVEHAKLRMRFNALPPAFRAMFGRVRDEYKALNAEFDATLLANVERSIEVGLRAAERDHEAAMGRIRDDGLKGRERAAAIAEADGRLASAKYRHRANRRARMADLRAEFETRTVPEPYFPLARFGSFFVTSRDAEGQVVGFSTFESPKAQQAFAKEQIAAGHKVDVGTLGETPVRGMVDPAFVQAVENILVDANVPDAVLDAVWQRWLHTMPDLSLRKSRIHRKGTPGFSSDALRAFGHHMFHGSHQLARLKYAILMDEALTLAEGQARMQADPVRSSLVIREMRRRHNYTMNPKGAWWSQMMTSAAFVYYLAMSPAAAAVNLSQTVIMGVPVLAAGVPKAGAAGAARELGRALRDFTRGKGHAAESDRLSPDEKEAMEEAYRRGTIDKSESHDLAGVGETGVEYSPTRTKVMAAISWAFHHTERLNREVTFLAAYRMARGDGMGHHDAIDKASELTWRTHFDYQNDSRPRIMQGDAARVLLVFRNFTFNMLFRLVRDTHQSINAADPAERREAITQLAGVTGMLFLSAGARGVWGYGLAISLIGLFFGGGSDEAEDEIKKAVVGTLGKNLGGMVLNGVPGHLTGTDLTSRIGMADLWFRSPDRILEGEDAYNYWLGEFLGAGFGMVERAYIGASMMMDGEWQRGMETLAPKSVRDILRSGRFATEGVTTMKGDSIIDDLPSLDVARQALGFTPAVLAERYDANRKLKNAEQRIMDERSTAMAAYANAIRRGEPTGDALRRVQEFNRAHPTYPITGESMRTSIRSRARASSRINGGIILNPKLDQVLRGDAPPMVYE